MILDAFNMLLSWVGSIFSRLDSFQIVGVGSVLAVVVISTVSGILVKTFISRGAHA